MSEVLLTLNQRYTLGVNSGSAVIETSTDGAEGKQIIRNRVLISGSHEPHVFGTEPTLEINQGQSYGIKINSSGSSVTDHQIWLENDTGGDCTIGWWTPGGTVNNIWTTGLSQTDGSFRIADASGLSAGSVRFKGYSTGDVELNGVDIRITGSNDLIAKVDRFVFETTETSEINTAEVGYALHIFNDGNGDSREGIKIQCGKDSNPGTSMAWISLADGNGDGKGWITGGGATVPRFTGTASGTHSDIRNKRHIKPIESSSLDCQQLLNDINVIEYKYKTYDWMDLEQDKAGDEYYKATRIGVSAQQMESILPYVVHDNEKLNISKGNKPGDSGYLWKEVNYEEIVPLLIQTSKQQDLRIIELENRIKILEETIK